jgi:hypothetical protein
VSLKEVAFEESRFVLGGTEHRLDPVDAPDHPSKVGPLAEVTPIGPDPAREIPASTYIDDAADAIAEEVDTGLMWKQPKGSRYLGFGRR